MGKIPDNDITATGAKTASYYEFLVSRYVAPHFTVTIQKAHIKNPNTVTFFSLLLILAASAMTADLKHLQSFAYRTLIAVIIQLSFILDCSDGQLARITGRTTKLGAWLDKIFDRVGEFIIFSVFGYAAWHLKMNVLFLFLGITTGYCLSAFTNAMALSSRVICDDTSTVEEVKKEEERQTSQKRKIEDSRFVNVLKKALFFLNFGIGERYLYLSVFIIINRLDIMLYISTLLSFMRMIGISHHFGQYLRTIDRITLQKKAI